MTSTLWRQTSRVRPANQRLMSGNRKVAEEAIHMLTELSARKYARLYNVATFHAGLGEMRAHLFCWRKFTKLGMSGWYSSFVDPRWDSERYAITEKRHLGKSQA